MPNWCYNNLSVSGPAEAMNSFMKIVDDQSFSFGAFVPMPEDLKSGGSSGEDIARLDATHGHHDWYSWALANWGTKWDVDPDSVTCHHFGDEFSASFSTAWSPPLAWMKQVSQQFPELVFHLSYEETNMGLVGIAVAEAGSLVDEREDLICDEDLEQGIFSLLEK